MGCPGFVMLVKYEAIDHSCYQSNILIHYWYKIVSLETWPQFSDPKRSDRLDNNVDGAAIYGDRKNRQRPIKRTTAAWNGMGS